MKHLLIIFSLLLTSVSWSKDVNFNDLVFRDGRYYEKFTDEPFTGNMTGIGQGKLIKGIKEGLWFWYLDNGQLYDKTYYKNGKLNGERFVYHASGELWWKGNYKNDKKDGVMITYHKNGNILSKEIYKDDKLIETINH